MFEIITFRRSQMTRIDAAEAEDAEAALLAGRTLYDDALTTVQGSDKVDVGFYRDGKLIRLCSGRP